MPSFDLSSPAAEQREASFVGLHPELCFAPTWLPRAKSGYATLTARDFRGTVSAHRLAVMLLVGPLEYGDMALHRCQSTRRPPTGATLIGWLTRCHQLVSHRRFARLVTALRDDG